MLDSTRHVAKALNHNMHVERDHPHIYFKNVMDQLTMFNNDRNTAKSRTFKKEVSMNLLIFKDDLVEICMHSKQSQNAISV